LPDLVLGPMLRYACDTEAPVWVETDAACEVEVLGHAGRTFSVAGRRGDVFHARLLALHPNIRAAPSRIAAATRW
jgi:hypothetical protein